MPEAELVASTYAALEDSFSMLSEYDKFSRMCRDPPTNLFNVVKELKRGYFAGTQSLGPGVYAPLRLEFSGTTSVRQLLTWNKKNPENNRPMSADLLKGIEALSAENKSRTEMMRFVCGSSAMNERERRGCKEKRREHILWMFSYFFGLTLSA